MADDPTTPLKPGPLFPQPPGALLNLGFRTAATEGIPNDSSDLAALQLHLPQYHVRELIGRGGMGNVMKVDDPKLVRAVALKVMNLGPEATEDERGRFIREATVLACLAHPNIVPIYDLGTDEAGCPFYTMKLVKGRTLQAILKDIRDGVPDAARQHSLDRLLSVFRKMCDAVGFAHSKGIIHRDLKPDNVMVGEFGEVLVMDWGLAKILGKAEEDPADAPSSAIRHPSSFGATLEGSVVGTPQYMSPEQAEGRVGEMDARSDIFSLGGILYAILTLHPPVEGKTLGEILRKVTSGDITPPSTYGTAGGNGAPRANSEVMEARKIKPLPHCPGGRVPAALSAVAMKALHVEKAARYQTVASLSADIESFQGGFATSAEQAGAWRQIALLIRRHKGVTSAIAAGFLIVAALSAAFIIKVARERNRAEEALSDLKKTAPTLLGLARNEADLQHFESALGKLDAALALDPTLLDAWWERGWALMALEKWKEAADVLSLAGEKDKTKAAYSTDALPLLGELAAGPDDAARFSGAHATALGEYLQRVGANSTLLALSKKIGLSNQARLALVRERINARLGKGVGGYSVSLDILGRVSVFASDSLSETIEILRGLPIDVLQFTPGTKLTDLDPLHGMPMQELNISYSRVFDLTPLSGLKLNSLNIKSCRITDISPLRDMPLVSLNMELCAVADITVLKGKQLRSFKISHLSYENRNYVTMDGVPSILRGMPLEDASLQQCGLVNLDFLADAPLRNLNVGSNPLQDISGLRGKQLESLILENTKVTDLSPLEGMPLKYLSIYGCPPDANLAHLIKVPTLRDLLLTANNTIEALRHHPGLKNIANHSVEQFWRVYDNKGFEFILNNPRDKIWDESGEKNAKTPSEMSQPLIPASKLDPTLLPPTPASPSADRNQVGGKAEAIKDASIVNDPGMKLGLAPIVRNPSIAVKAIPALTTSYEDTTLADITKNAAQLSADKIDGSDGNELAAGTWATYQTSEGNFGKFKVAELQETSLILEWITYNRDGSIRSSGKKLSIDATWPFDLDSGSVPGPQGQADFHWQGVTHTIRCLVPINHALCAIIRRGKN